MDQLSRSQILVYGAVAVAVLLIGAKWVGANPEPGTSSGFSGEAGGIDPGGGTTGAGSGAGRSTPLVSGEGQSVVVHVAGAVRKPGVYRMPGGSRVIDAVQRAGGATGAAEVGSINLAAQLADGQQVIVPGRIPGSAGTAAVPGDGPISLGSATIEQLEELDGIGPVTAAAIIEYRDENGGIGAIEELEQVSGIGPATIEALRDDLQP